MATKLTSIHKANDSNGFAVSFQLDYEIGANDFQMHITHSSAGRIRETELDIPLSEVADVIKSLTQIMEEKPSRENWCVNCGGSGEVPALNGMGFPHMRDTCPDCKGKGIHNG